MWRRLTVGSVFHLTDSFHVAAVTLKMASNSGAKKRTSSENGATGAKKSTGPWFLGLKAAMDDPEAKVDEDETIVIIKDKYPKVRFIIYIL